MIISAVSAMPYSALAETSGDWKFELTNDNTAKITGYSGKETDIVIPSEIEGYSVVAIGGFASNNTLTSVKISEGITEIKSAAFAMCTGLTSLSLPNSLLTIGWDSFDGCKSLPSVKIPDGVKEIGRWAFAGCTALNDIIIPDSVETILPDAFNNTAYYNNESNWENHVLYIGNYLIKAKDGVSDNYSVKDGTVAIAGNAFCEGSADEASKGIETLTAVIIPNSVKTIGPNAFGFCTGLTTVTIGSGTTYINNGAFENCSSLETVYYNGTTSEWNDIIIQSNNDYLTNATIHCTDAPPNKSVKSLEVVIDGTIEITEGDFYEYDEDWDDSIGEVNYYCYQVNRILYANHDNVYFVVTYDDGSAEEFVYDYYYDDFVNDEYDNLELSYRHDQYKNPWTVGVNYFTVEYNGATAQVPVTLKANPVKSISYTPVKPIEYTEYVDGYWKYYKSWDEEAGIERKEEYFSYNIPRFKGGDVLTVTYNDGRGTVDYTYDEDNYEFVSANGDTISEYDINRSLYFNGESYSFQLEYLNFETEAPITIVENPIASIEYTPAKPIQLIENYDGYMYSDEDGEWCSYNTPDFNDGDKFVVNYKNGKAEEYTVEHYGEYNNIHFVDKNGNEIDEEPYINTYQNVDRWSLGSENYMTVTYKGIRTKVPVTIIENPVESIEFELASPVILYENEGGHFEDDEGNWLYKDEKGYFWCEGDPTYYDKVYVEPENVFFFYTRMPVYKEGNKLTVHYKDGTSKVLTHHFIFDDDHEGYYFVNSDGSIEDNNVEFKWTIDSANPFRLGSDNRITVSYLNTTTQIPVTVVENNLDYIEYKPLAPLSINVDDEREAYGYYDFNNEERAFNITSKLAATGNQLIAHFKDGTSKTYTFYHKQKDGRYNPVEGGYYYLIDETGGVINYSSFSWKCLTESWRVGNTYDITIKYMNAETTVPISIVSNTVAHTHSYSAVTVAPTCTDKGYTVNTCSCGDTYNDNYVDALGHSWDNGKVTKAATPTATGVMTYTCTVCGTKTTKTIAKCAKYANTLTANGKTATVKFKNLKKKNQTVAQKNAFSISKAQGKVTYKKSGGNKSITVSSAGKITVKKGLKKGTYKVKVKVTAAGNATYKSGSKTVTVTIKVK